MLLVVTTMVTLLLRSSDSYDLCTRHFCPPYEVRPQEDQILTPAQHVLGTDKESGCTCRETPNKFSVCYGIERNCKYFPKGKFNLTAPLLNIKTTLIEEFKEGDLDELSNLRKLIIEGNSRLKRIGAYSFRTLENLTELSLIHNQILKRLERDSFFGLKNLKVLILVKNAFNSIPDISIALRPDLIPQFVRLDLNENSFTEILENDFAPMANSTLKELNMILCRIEYIHFNALKYLPELKSLNLGENSFNITTITNLINTTIQQEIPLESLDLSAAGLRKDPPKELMSVIAKSNINSLVLARNQFVHIDSESFGFMPNLITLDLSAVYAQTIAADAFEDVPNLKTLILSNNRLSSLPHNFSVNNLTFLDLHQNSDLNSSWYFNLSWKAFSSMLWLEHLDLCYCKINSIFKASFPFMPQLKILELKNSSIYYIAKDTFINMPGLELLNLEDNYFARVNGTSGVDLALFENSQILQVLLLGGNGIRFIANTGDRDSLKYLKHLGLENNEISTISSLDFSSFIQLRSLYLSFNHISSWDVELFSTNAELRFIEVNHNKITHFTKVMLADLQNASHLEISGNPFSCDCKMMAYYRDFTTPEELDQIIDILERQNILCFYPDVAFNVTLANYLRYTHMSPNICFKSKTKKFFIILPIALTLIAFAALGIAVYVYRWRLHYWMFLARMQLSRKAKLGSKPTSKVFNNYTYDAFVSYSNVDQSFVMRLVSMLENYEPFLKLCVYERDFQIGTMISESVLACIAKSRKTILVVSNSYAKSHWCLWETQIAEHHRLFFQDSDGDIVNDSLLMIKLGSIKESNLTPTLKYLLKTRIYLQWDPDERREKVFWQKLRNHLAPPKSNHILSTHI